jgi:hypothetical protein
VTSVASGGLTVPLNWMTLSGVRPRSDLGAAAIVEEEQSPDALLAVRISTEGEWVPDREAPAEARQAVERPFDMAGRIAQDEELQRLLDYLECAA